MALMTSEGVVYVGSLAGAYSYARISTSTISVNAGSDGSSTGLPSSQSLRELLLLVLARGAMEWELA
jgi:hypothetical protein